MAIRYELWFSYYHDRSAVRGGRELDNSLLEGNLDFLFEKWLEMNRDWIKLLRNTERTTNAATIKHLEGRKSCLVTVSFLEGKHSGC